MIFCQLPNGRFSPNLATTRESMSPQKVSEWIFENFPFRGHLPPKPHNWIVSNRYIIQTSLQPRGRTAEILFTTRCSPRAREIPGFGQIYAPCVSPPWETPRERSLSPQWNLWLRRGLTSDIYKRDILVGNLLCGADARSVSDSWVSCIIWCISLSFYCPVRINVIHK